jgi:hypothetical protein
MTRVKKVFVVAASLMAIAACGSSGSKNGSGASSGNNNNNNAPGDTSATSDAPLTADEQACDDYFKAQLAFSHKCGGALSDSPDALIRYRQLCSREFAAPGADNLRAARAKCTQSRLAAACDATLPECDLPPGTLANGAACADRVQCQSRYCAVGSSGCGTCADRVAAGGKCTLPTDCAFGDKEVASCDYQGGATNGTCTIWKIVGVGAECGVNSFCDGTSNCVSDTQNGPGKCVANAAEGGDCIDSNSCVPGLACLSGKCAQKPKEGEACEASNDCVDGLACNGTCQKESFVSSGQECSTVEHCERGLCVQQVQSDGDGGAIAAGSPACVAPISDGDACGPNNQGLACDFFATCVGGKCVFADPTQCK